MSVDEPPRMVRLSPSSQVTARHGRDSSEPTTPIPGAPWWVRAIQWAAVHSGSLLRLLTVVLILPMLGGVTWAVWILYRDSRTDAEQVARVAESAAREVQSLRVEQREVSARWQATLDAVREEQRYQRAAIEAIRDRVVRR